MKKLTKFVSLLLTVAMVLTMVACHGTTDPSTSTSGSYDSSKPTPSVTDGKSDYVIKVQTAGGMPMEKIDLEIYNDSNLVDIGATGADGSYTVKLAASKEYSVKLTRIPAGYEAQESYSFTGNSCVISLESSVITDEKISGTKFQLGDIMYDFEFTDSDGITRKLSETLAEKKMVMLNFWYSDCSWCYKEFPAINTVYGDFKNEIEIFALNDYPGETIDDVKSWKHSDMNLQFPMGLITNGLGIGSFGGGGWPMTVIIDRYGMVAMAHAGAITSEYVWKQIFTHFTADNYQQKLVKDYNDIVSIQEPTEEFPGNDVIAGAINQGDINVNYYPADEKTDGEAWKYVWPFVETTFNGETCIKASNNRVDSSYAILYADVELKAGQAVGFDYIISSEQGMDVAIIIIDGNDIYQMSGYDTNQQWKTCYPWVALQDGTYTLAICYMKDGTNNVGDDTMYIDNMRVVDAKDIEVDSYIPRQAAVKQDNGTFSYVDIFYNEADGYYHVDSVNGPLLLANLMGYTQFNGNDFVYNMADGLVQNGINFYEELTLFASYATNATLTGYCTVTQELAELLRQFAKIKGFENSDDEWLKICEYYQAYGPGGTQLEDPIKGLAPFSAPDAVLGTWKQNETTGKWEFTAENGEEGENNLFVYDRAIMPRGKFFAFTPEVSGAYRITSHSNSANGLDAWIFSEESFYDRAPIYTYAAEERLRMEGNNVSMVYYMEAGETYYIDIAFWDVYEVGTILFDLVFLGETYDMFRVASPGPFTYVDGTNYIVAGGIEVELGEDGIYYHVQTDKDGNKVRGSKLYADFTMVSRIFNLPLIEMIEMGAFDFSKNEYDQEIMTYLKNNNGDVEATREYLKKLWGADYDLYADAYKLEEILAGTYHGEGEDMTDEIKAFLDDVIDMEGDITDGCVVVTEELAELLQMLMDKFTFEGVEQSWRKLCYYFDYMGR